MTPILRLLQRQRGGIQLRPYQADLVCEAERILFDEDRDSVVIVLSTGAGKTVIFSQLTKNADARGQSVWIIAHRQELIRQASKTLHRFTITHGIVRAGFPLEMKQIQVASVQTLIRRLAKLNAPDIIVIDECHHAVAPTYRKIRAAYPQAKVAGVTATPCLINGGGLGSDFDHMIQGPSNAFLVENRYLPPVRYFAPPKKADTSRLPIRAGDYGTHESEEAMNQHVVTGDAIEHYKRICDGVPILVFCVSVKHAQDVAQEYCDAGYLATSVDGKLDEDERDDRINGLTTGKYVIITSCDLIGEGLDVPAVAAVQLLRPTQSLRLHLQQIGRPRYAPGRTAIVLDHVGNTEKHGFASTDFKWSLEGIKKRRKSDDKITPTRTCEQCYSVHVTRAVCPYCGFTYLKKSRSLTSMKVVDGDLVEVEQTREERADEVKNAKSLKELIAIGKARGHKRPHYWAIQTFRGRSYVQYLPR